MPQLHRLLSFGTMSRSSEHYCIADFMKTKRKLAETRRAEEHKDAHCLAQQSPALVMSSASRLVFVGKY
jgi:hypothetical protein